MSTVTSIADKRDLEWRVRLMLAERFGYDAEELDSSFRLRADLHMDGDDAVDFFERFGSEFHVDLMQLRSCWSFYFNPQNTWLSKPAKLAMIVAASAGLLEWVLFPHFSPVAGFVTVFGIFIVILFSVEIAQRLNRNQGRPGQQEITVGELVEAARSGKWNVAPEIEAWLSKEESFRSLT